MRQPTIKEIHSVLFQKGMEVFKTPFSVTLGAIRTADNESNKFNDWIFCSFFTPDGGLVSAIFKGTTDAGLYFRNNPANINGTAIIQHGKQYRGVYQFQDPEKNPGQRGHKGKEAFRQVKNMDYWRDQNKDNYLDFSGETFTEIAYTNGHDMGTTGNNVDKWSAGCWGAVAEQMDILYLFAKMQIEKGLGDKFSFALLHENDF